MFLDGVFLEAMAWLLSARLPPLQDSPFRSSETPGCDRAF